MITHRITRIAAIALAIAATTAPTAAAQPVDGPAKPWTLPRDFESADARDSVGRGIYEPVAPESTQDLRHADTVDYANGRGTYNSPEVIVVDLPQPVVEPVSVGGIDWADAGLGAGSLLGITLIGLGGALFVVHRRGARALAS